MSRAEDLFNSWLYMDELTNEEILELEKDVREFFQSDEPIEDKKELWGYMENLSMFCSGIREGRFKNRKPSPPVFPKKRYTFELEIPEFVKRKIQHDSENK